MNLASWITFFYIFGLINTLGFFEHPPIDQVINTIEKRLDDLNELIGYRSIDENARRLLTTMNKKSITGSGIKFEITDILDGTLGSAWPLNPPGLVYSSLDYYLDFTNIY